MLQDFLLLLGEGGPGAGGVAALLASIIWLGFLAVTWQAASKRDRSPVGWVVWAIVLGPLGFLALAAVLVLGKNEKLRPCPACFGDVNVRARLCRFCGEELPPVAKRRR